MFRSIRYTLLLWQAAILVVALGLFGSAFYGAAAHGRMRVMDEELESAARAIVGRLLTPPARSWDTTAPTRPFVWHRPPHGVPHDWTTKVRAEFLDRPGLAEADQPYFVITADDGYVVARSDHAPPGVPPAPPPHAPAAGERPDPAVFRTRGANREVLVTMPVGPTVLVGQPMAGARRELAGLRWVLLAVGGGVLAVGMVGGWVLANRATAPIRAISAAAAAISTGDPSADAAARLPLPPAGSELAPLARTLNESFDRLRAAYDRQTRFTADASHELRTPLAVIRSQTDLALRRPRSADEYRHTLAACGRAAARMSELVDSLLLLATADAGRPAAAREAVDLSAVARDVAALLAPLADDRRIDVQLDLSPAAALGDRGQLARVASNLLGNAIRYNREGGSVRLATGRVDGRAVLTVADTGLGIAAADQPRLFERFFRADAARSRDTGGSGLGLSICQRIVHGHGGTIAIDSVPDQGTTVTVRLPTA